ncbi:MAG: helix-turn-helix domain-containing protein [Acidimicrobiales bacterium]
MEKREWLTMDQLANELGETRSTLNKWKARGKFPHFVKKPNGRLYFNIEDVYEWLDSLTVPS